ncbi:1-phosphofructokinase family hexose kinase [Enterococcus sp.]|uniref:1-phosphofructokinase family hexose kinase n=1 Tax=Enterococcus sp. TaxID=35783 RepID=UPI002906F0CC|nr:PfkB family carbohydrate kinase [Enterococcus sp.]MDU5333983.1 PfkB family carbohydrate kinase [Enterococcus sp.]
MIHLVCPNPAIDRTLMVDGFVKSLPNRPYEVKEFPGGKGFNVAYAIGFEDPAVEFCVHTIAGGRNGEYLGELAIQNKVPVKFTKIDRNTRVCNIIMDTKNHITYPIYENSFQLNDELLKEYTDTIKESIHEGDYIVFSGSLMKGMPANYIAAFIDEFRVQKVKIFVDTSGDALREAYQAQPYAIKINDEEILDIFPGADLTTIDSYAALLASEATANIPVFIITLGENGIIAKINDQILAVKAKKVAAKNPIACGDFFLGGLVKNLATGQSPEFTLKKAISYSTANVLSWYPELNHPQITEIFDSLKVTKY